MFLTVLSRQITDEGKCNSSAAEAGGSSRLVSELKLRPPNAEERSRCSLAGLKHGLYDLSSGAEESV